MLQKKTLNYKYAPGKWCLFGGKVKQGEKPEDTIRREIKEEIGYKLDKLKLFKVKDYRVKNFFQGKEYIFISSFKSDVSDISLSEGAGFAFFASSEIENLDMMEMCFGALKEYIGNKLCKEK